MPTIAFLGLGAMGSRIAKNLLDAGHDLIVWNRSDEKTKPLVEAGARRVETPREAGETADIVMAMVADDEASRTVWLDPETGALAGMGAGKTAIEISTLQPGWVEELGKAMKAQGVDLLEAPVSGTLPQAENADLVFFLGGERSVIEKAEPFLQSIGKASTHVGQWGDGARVKLATNAMLGIHVAAWAEILSMLDRSPTDTKTAVEAISKTSVWAPNFGYLTKTMIDRNFEPKFPIDLIEKDFRYAMGVAGEAEAPLLRQVHEAIARAISQGYGKDNMTALRKLYE
ncbi:MAG: NAD(P)-dependent oxidoreductase [Fulvimarina manganoxydans]|uniref:NAD(P)-dependent oxidoreductase n=1 Tax=Fulvimarina manganoxydans TaxID=937218 RepID=UPI0023539C38|nr:NAD(P)-dependent oxidoreductase [Fulvimarina manganoxydans]MCK5930880.1 NAD(P)-dependent oxidoreductase [Fulvimarina manganoxydans]